MDNKLTGQAIVFIPSYDGDNEKRVGFLVAEKENKNKEKLMIVQFGHLGTDTRPYYRAYRLDKCDKGVNIFPENH
jgi:hypothetical protein